ncbi:MAG: leucine-rich repeat protein, partial [Oscillospiraceae bacterium]|nr:leucine-rich repeat protein [Oscillospiraceae bacterium]
MKLKRILATALALALLFSIAPIASAAWENAPELALETSVNDDVITVTLKTAEATALSALDFTLTYPTDAVTLKSTKNQINKATGFYNAPDPEDPESTLNLSSTINIAAAGEVGVAFAGEENISFAADATLAVVNFTISDPKSMTFTFSSLSAGSAGLGSYNYTGEEIPSVTYAPPHDHSFTNYVADGEFTSGSFYKRDDKGELTGSGSVAAYTCTSETKENGSWERGLVIGHVATLEAGGESRISVDIRADADMDFEVVYNKDEDWGAGEKGFGAEYGKHVDKDAIVTIEHTVTPEASGLLNSIRLDLGKAPLNTTVTVSNVKVEKVSTSERIEDVTYPSAGNATCKTDGTETATCDYCDETDTRPIVGSHLSVPHTPDGVTDCATASYCTVCGALLRAAGEHSWNSGEEITAPTCEAKGSALFTCTVCGTTETRDVDALGHLWTPTGTTAATCTTPGYTSYVCSRDGSHTKDDDFVEALGHLFTNYVPDGNATCKDDGTKTATCDRDGCNVTDTIVDVGSHLNVAHTPDGNTDCSKATYCTVCGAVTKPAGEHSWNEGVVTVEPGIAAGEKTYTCTVCGETRTETLDPIIFTGKCGDDATWTVNTQTGTLTIAGTGAMADYSAKTDVPWYGYVDKITMVVVADGITAIGNRAFFDCANLTDVTIPASVTVLGDAAFYNCSSLTGVELPADLTSIGAAAFRNCTSLAAIEIPAKVTTIGQQAFYNCTSLTSIEIPNGVEEIKDYTHQYDESLTEVTIPASVTSIGTQAFYGCSALKDVYYAGTQEDWDKVTIGQFNDGLSNATIHCHEHSFTYEVDGTTMKQTCTCGNEATATISASDATYDGKAHEATVVYSENWLADETVAVEYSENGNVNAGAVTATLVAGTGDGKKEISVNYTIAKATMDVTVATKTLLSKEVLGENMPKEYIIDLSTLIPADAGNPVFTWAEGNETQYGMAEIGGTTLTYTVTTPQDAKVTTSLKVKVTSNNYNDVDTLVIPFEFKDKVDVSDKLSLYTIEVDGKEFVVGGGTYDLLMIPPVVLYDGKESENITIVYTDANDKQYAELTKESLPGVYTYTATYEDDIPEGEIPGHIGTISGELTIEKGYSDPWVGSPSKQYDGEPAALILDQNYGFSGDGTATVTWYTVTAKDEEGEITEKTALDAAPTDVGEYCVVVTVAETEKYRAQEVSIGFDIDPRPVTIKVADAMKEYGTEDPAFTGTVVLTDTDESGLVADGDLGTISYHRTEADADKEGYGTVELTATYTPNANYIVEIENGTLTITKTQPTLAQIAKFENIEATYNGKAVTAEITAAEGVEGLGKITVKYRTGDAAATTKAPVNAGTYTVVASIAEGANYAAKDLDVGTLTIAKADRNLTELPESIELLPTDLTATLAPKYD